MIRPAYEKVAAFLRDATIVAGILGFSCFAAYYAFSYDHGRAIEMVNTVLEKDSIYEGEDLTIAAHVNIKRSCPTAVHRAIMDTDNRRVVWTEIRPMAINKLGDNQKMRIQVNVPMLKPGNYEYSAVFFPACAINASPATHLDPLPFKVLPKG